MIEGWAWRALWFAIRFVIVGWLLVFIEPFLLALIPPAIVAILLQHFGVLVPSESTNG